MADAHHSRMRGDAGFFREREAGHCDGGFTLVEVVMVVLLVAVLATVGVPQIVNALNGMKLTAAAEEIVLALRYAQSLSQREGIAHGVELDKDLNTIRCYRQDTGAIILNPLDKRPYEIDLDTLHHAKGVVIADAVFGANVDYVEFDSEGETAAAATDATTAGSVLLQAAGLYRKITVSAPLGRVTVQEP